MFFGINKINKQGKQTNKQNERIHNNVTCLVSWIVAGARAESWWGVGVGLQLSCSCGTWGGVCWTFQLGFRNIGWWTVDIQHWILQLIFIHALHSYPEAESSLTMRLD